MEINITFMGFASDKVPIHCNSLATCYCNDLVFCYVFINTQNGRKGILRNGVELYMYL